MEATTTQLEKERDELKKKLKDLKSEETEFFESKTKQSEANKLKADAEVNFGQILNFKFFQVEARKKEIEKLEKKKKSYLAEKKKFDKMRSSLDEILKATRLEYLKLQGEEKALEESETLAKG